MLALRALVAFLALPGTVTVLVPWLLLRRSSDAPGMFAVLGLLPLGVGGVLLLWCVVDFARVGRGTLAPVDPPTVLMRRGLYRFVRNPMYVAVVTILIGEALVFGSSSIAWWAAGCAVAFHVRVVRYEEPVLRRSFGADFDDYCRRVPRWIPKPPR